MSALNYMLLLNQYNNIENELNYLFEKKYATPDKFVKFIYYMQNNVCADSIYVLIDKSNGTWEFSNRIKDVMLFLEIFDNSIVSDIYDIMKKDQEIRYMLEQQGITPEIDYGSILCMALL